MQYVLITPIRVTLLPVHLMVRLLDAAAAVYINRLLSVCLLPYLSFHHLPHTQAGIAHLAT